MSLGSVTMRVDGITFPPSAIEYLRRHKRPGDMIQPLVERQVHRARKQLEDLGDIAHPREVLDIGCGLAVVDALLALRGAHTIRLMDGDGTAERHGEYREQSEAWNDVQTGVDMVRANAPESCRVIAHQPRESFAISAPFDMVISLKSWGLHYPVHTYLDTVRRCIRRGGLLVIDIHREVEGRAEIEAAGFELLRTVGEVGEPAPRTIIPFTRHIFQRG